VSGSGELTVVQGDVESLTVEADNNLLTLIRAEVHNGRLSIGPRNVNLRPTKAIVYRLSVKNLKDLELSGSVHGKMDAIKTDRLALHLSGSGRMEVPHLEAGTLSTHISGAGSTSVGGEVEKQEIRISGSGNHHASDLKCAQAEARISGSGHVSLWVTQSLAAHISGSGHVEYRGNATVDAHVSGSGRVRRHGGAD
jgi:hypothetical protein